MRNPGSFVITACALFGAGLLIVAPVRAQNESVKAVFEKHDLLGMFAYDCGKPVSKENEYYVNRVLDDGHVQRDAMIGQSTREWVAIIDKAVELSSDRLAIGGKRNDMPIESVWRIEANRARTEETTLGDKKLIAAGKFTGNGADTQWVYKCDAPGASAQTAASPATGPQEDSVKALFEKYKLLGVFASDCSKPPKPGDNWYYVNRLIDSNHVQHDLMESGTARAKVTIIDNARELRPNEIVVMGTVDNKPAAGVWRMAADKMVQWESAVNGELEVTGGKRVQTGADMPWITRCSD